MPQTVIAPPAQDKNACDMCKCKEVILVITGWSNFVCRVAVKQNKAHKLKFVPDNFFATSTFRENSTSRALEEIQEFFKNLFQIKDILRVSFFMQGLFETM